MNNEKVDNLLNALENDTNSSIMKLTSAKIKEHKNNILQRLQIKGTNIKCFHKKLKFYRYCSEMSDLQYGYYIRWISLKDPMNLSLTNGAMICDIKFINNKIQILCKNARHRFVQIKFDEVIIFQKLSQQEQVILSVLDYLH